MVEPLLESCSVGGGCEDRSVVAEEGHKFGEVGR